MADTRLSNTVAEHRKKAGPMRASVAVITLSSTRSAEDDESGDLIQKLLEDCGHRVPIRKIITDSRNVLRATLRELIRVKEIQVVITTGGTGLAASDITVETVKGMLEKELPGFNSLFMMLSYPQVKSASMLSRATAGLIKGKVIFCIPGSPKACRLAMESLILPELGHILHLVSH
jgi:molybdopterin adenylyltransferase